MVPQEHRVTGMPSSLFGSYLLFSVEVTGLKLFIIVIILISRQYSVWKQRNQLFNPECGPMSAQRMVA